MADTSGQSLDQLERNAERSREDLSRTVDELHSRISDTASDLRHRVSPAAIKQDVKDYAQQTGQQLFHTLERKARENPLQAVAVAAALAYPAWRILRSMPAPILLVGAGIALSRPSGRGSSVEHRLSDQGREGIENAKAALSDGVRQASTAMRNAADKTAEQVSGVMDKVGSAVSSGVDTVVTAAGDTVSGARDAARRMASTAVSAVSDAAGSSYQGGLEASSNATDRVVRAGQQTRESFRDALEQHPLLVGGVGLAIGALIAAAIPATAPEKRLFGETSDELQRRARDMASRGLDAARTAAEEIYEDTVAEAKDQGLTAENLRAAADDLGKKAKAVAERATSVVSPRGKADVADAAGQASSNNPRQKTY